MIEYKRIFIDTAPFIYYLENNPMYFDKMMKFFSECLEKEVEMVTSAITVEEYLVYPYSNFKMELAENFERFLSYMKIEIIPTDKKIAKKGARIRAEYKDFKAMDSLQIATAVESGCDVFFTNDKQLRLEKELPCITMDDLE